MVNSAGLFPVGTDYTDVTTDVTSNKAKNLNGLYVILDRSEAPLLYIKTKYTYTSLTLVIYSFATIFIYLYVS